MFLFSSRTDEEIEKEAVKIYCKLLPVVLCTVKLGKITKNLVNFSTLSKIFIRVTSDYVLE